LLCRFYGDDGRAKTDYDFGHDLGTGDPHAHDGIGRSNRLVRKKGLLNQENNHDRRFNSIWVGWVNSSISDLFKDMPELIDEFFYVLITSIDSSRDMHNIKTIYNKIHEWEECSFFNGSLLITNKIFHKIFNSYNLFNGFDEVWFFHSIPSIKIPSEIWITAPLEIVDNIPDGLLEWMTASGCVLGLGDGVGMNYVTIEKRIVDLLENYHIK
jgi:hypothetical protein